MRKYFFFCTLALSLLAMNHSQASLPSGFVYLKNIEPTIIQDMKYASTDNFIGKRVKGYHVKECIVTIQATEALKKI